MNKLSLVEGSGNFECTAECHASQPFKTTNLKEFNAHLQTEGHYAVNGTTECSQCGNPYHFERLDAGTKPVCDNCSSPTETYSKGKKKK